METITFYIEEAHKNAVDKGWWETGQRDEKEIMCLILSEMYEAFEFMRKPGQKDEHLPDEDPIGLECADVCIRIFDYSGFKGYRIFHGMFIGGLIYDSHPIKDGIELVSKVTYWISKALTDDVSVYGNEEIFRKVLMIIFGYCKYHQIKIESLIQKKMEYNKSRPYKHGKKF